MNDRIYPLAYTLAPNQTQTLYYLGFPEAWKDTLLELAQKSNPRFKDEHGLPTNALKKLMDSWMEGVIALSPLKRSSHDEHWLTSCYEYTERDIQTLCGIIKAWVKATYIASSKVSPMAKKLANDFCEQVRPEELSPLQSKATVCLTFENGTVGEEAYQAIPLLAVNHLLGKEIALHGQTLHLCYSGKNQLISQPISDAKSRHQYSFCFDFSVQTTPPQRKALLLCQMSIRRWIPGEKEREKAPYISESINAHIKVSENKYCQVPISRRIGNWKNQDKECYNIYGYEPLPSAADVLRNPAKYASRVLLPYKNGMRGFSPSKIGTGVSILDKATLYKEVGVLLCDIIGTQPEALRERKPHGQNFPTFESPQGYSSREAFRSWVRKCTDTDQITFELYGLLKDLSQREILDCIEEKLIQDFGENTADSCLKIQCLRKEAGSLADSLPDDSNATKIQKSGEISKYLGTPDAVTACVFVIPDREHYAEGDPKQVLRNAFACSGRVVQFINPDTPGDINENKIENTVYDLYRQLGVVTLLDPEKEVPPYASTPCIGMHICTQVKGCANKGRFLPIYVMVDVLEGKTRVYCDAFSKRMVSYREACLEMAQLFWRNDLEQCCADASRSPAKQMLIGLKNHYYQPDDCVLLVVQSDGNTRALWSGISDKEIGSYEVSEEYCPIQINAGMPKNPIPLSMQNTGIRIVRIRSNQEVPDYFTNFSRKSTSEHIQYSTVSGVFKYGGVFWGIHDRPGDQRYSKSPKMSKIDHPAEYFAEKDMVELYPLQLQPGDEAVKWIFYTNALRHIPIQYKQSTILPLPLHLAKALEEYLFNIENKESRYHHERFGV